MMSDQINKEYGQCVQLDLGVGKSHSVRADRWGLQPASSTRQAESLISGSWYIVSVIDNNMEISHFLMMFAAVSFSDTESADCPP